MFSYEAELATLEEEIAKLPSGDERVDGMLMPSDVACLYRKLDGELDELRLELVASLLFQKCRSISRNDILLAAAEKKLAVERSAFNLAAYAYLLISGCEADKGFQVMQEALCLAVAEDNNVNYISASYLRYATQTGDVARVNHALQFVIQHYPSTGYSGDDYFEWEWCAAATDLGADSDLLDALVGLFGGYEEDEEVGDLTES